MSLGGTGRLSAALCRCHWSADAKGVLVVASAGTRVDRSMHPPTGAGVAGVAGCGTPAPRSATAASGQRSRSVPGWKLPDRLTLHLSELLRPQSGHDHAGIECYTDQVSNPNSRHELLRASRLGHRGSDAGRQRQSDLGTAHRAMKEGSQLFPQTSPAPSLRRRCVTYRRSDRRAKFRMHLHPRWPDLRAGMASARGRSTRRCGRSQP